MQAAIKAVRDNEMGYLKAAKYYKVPRTTLYRFSRMEGNPAAIIKTKIGRKTRLSTEIEDELVSYLLLLEEKFFGLYSNDVRRMAYQLAAGRNMPNPFPESSGIAGKGWLKLFLQRHSDKISLNKPSCPKENFKKFFQILDEEMNKKKYPPERVFNVDERGFFIDESKIPEIVVAKGIRQICAIRPSKRDSLITVVLAMSAAGDFIPPMIIFPMKNMNYELIKGAPAGSIFGCHPSGWIQSDLFTQWFIHFLEKTEPSKNSPVLLIIDGHYSHTRNVDVIKLAEVNHVTIICLPPYSAQKLQPLEKSYMDTLKFHYREQVRLFIHNTSRSVSSSDVVELFGNAYLKVKSAEIAINGFRATGIYPLNKHIFNDWNSVAKTEQSLDNKKTDIFPDNQIPDSKATSPNICKREKSSRQSIRLSLIPPDFKQDEFDTSDSN